jgi:hypothetical protein
LIPLAGAAKPPVVEPTTQREKNRYIRYRS